MIVHYREDYRGHTKVYLYDVVIAVVEGATDREQRNRATQWAQAVHHGMSVEDVRAGRGFLGPAVFRPEDLGPSLRGRKRK